MASFATDVNTINSLFKPYVQELPVEALTAVGVSRQTAYNEGIQKIQSTIDSVAEMDIIRDVDKNYLQTKLNKLGSDLKAVAAGDFSNFQLVNSVGSMTTGIAKDPNVVNALNSTMKYRKELVKMEDARKAGKSSLSREADFYNDVNSWMDGSLGQPFSGTFREFVDVNKKVLDVIQKLHPKVNVYEIPNLVDKNGNINYKNLSSTLTRVGETMVDEGQIKTAVNSMLDINDLDELASRGRYAYKQYSPESLMAINQQSYNTTKKNYENKLNELEKKKLLTNDPKYISEINDAIEYYKNMIGDSKTGVKGLLDEKFEEIQNNVADNPDGARAALYTRNWLDEIANGFAYRELESETKVNPSWETDLKMRQYNLDVLRESNLEKHREISDRFEERKLNLLEADAMGGGGLPVDRTYTNASEELNSAEKFTNHLVDLKNRNDELVKSIAKSRSSLTTKVTPADVKRQIENGTFTAANQDELALLRQYKQNNRIGDTLNEAYKLRENEAYKTVVGVDKETFVKEKVKEIGTVKVEHNGKTYSYSPEEIYSYLNKKPIKLHKMPTFNPAMPISVSTTGKDELTEKEEILKIILEQDKQNINQQSMGQWTGMGVIPTKPQDVPYISILRKKFKEVSTTIADTESKVVDVLDKELKDYTGEVLGSQAAIQFPNENAKKNFMAALSNQVAVDMRIDVAKEGYKPDEAITWLDTENANNVSFGRIINDVDGYKINITNNKDGKTQEVPVSPEFIRAYVGELYLSENRDVAADLIYGGGTTNPFRDFKHAKYQKEDIGSFVNGNWSVNFPVAADLDLGKDGKLYATMKVERKSGTWDIVEIPEPVNKQQFEQYLNYLTDEDLINLFASKGIDITKNR